MKLITAVFLVCCLIPKTAYSAEFAKRCAQLLEDNPRLVAFPKSGIPENALVAPVVPEFDEFREPLSGGAGIKRLSPDEVFSIAYDRRALAHFVGGYRDPYAPSKESERLTGDRLNEFTSGAQRSPLQGHSL